MIPPVYDFALDLLDVFCEHSMAIDKHRCNPLAEHVAVCHPDPKAAALEYLHTGYTIVQKGDAYFVKGADDMILEIMPDSEGWYPHIAFRVENPTAVADLCRCMERKGFSLIESSSKDPEDVNWHLLSHGPEGPERKYVQIIWRKNPLFA